MTILVSFVQYADKLQSEILDIQYHVFTDCTDRYEFIFDSVYHHFIVHGYVWSAIIFPIDLAYQCGFTISKCSKDKELN